MEITKVFLELHTMFSLPRVSQGFGPRYREGNLAPNAHMLGISCYMQNFTLVALTVLMGNAESPAVAAVLSMR
jgi:hypothetical protein